MDASKRAAEVTGNIQEGAGKAVGARAAAEATADAGKRAVGVTGEAVEDSARAVTDRLIVALLSGTKEELGSGNIVDCRQWHPDLDELVDQGGARSDGQTRSYSCGGRG